MQRFLRIAVSVFFVLPIAIGCRNGDSGFSPDENSVSRPEQTTDGWETASLGDVGMDEAPLRDLLRDIEDGVFREVHSVLIVKDGRLVFECYFPGHDFGYTGENFHGDYILFNRNTLHNTHSATKSVTSAIIGLAIEHGFIEDVDEKVFDFFPGCNDLRTDVKDRISIEHMLTMTSGLAWNEWDVSIATGEHDIVQFNNSLDPIRFLLSKDVVTEPGAAFYYNGGGVDLLGEIVRVASGMFPDAFSETYLFGPLGVERYQWQRLRSGIICCHGDIYIRPRDLAKFGTLFLNEGSWNGEQIISAEWVRRSFEEYIPLPQVYWADGYGYLWWMRSLQANGRTYESYKAMGWGGQEIFIFPEQDMVVVFTGANYVTDPPCDDIVTRYILPTLP